MRNLRTFANTHAARTRSISPCTCKRTQGAVHALTGAARTPYMEAGSCPK